MSARAAVVHARQDIGWGEFARLVEQARASAERDGLGQHSLTRVGLRALQMDLEGLVDAVGAAIPAAEGIEPNDETIRALRAAMARYNEGVPE